MKDQLDQRMDAWTRELEEVEKRHVELIKMTGRILDLRLMAEMLGDRLDDFENDFLSFLLFPFLRSAPEVVLCT